MEGEPGGRRARWKVNQVEGEIKPGGSILGGRRNRWKGKSHQVLEGEPTPRDVKSGAQ